MAQEIINIGAFDDDPSAEKIRQSFAKAISNFAELYERTNNSTEYIPLAGTAFGTAVTGPIKVLDGVDIYCESGALNIGRSTGSDVFYLSMLSSGTLELVASGVFSASKGLSSSTYFGANYDDNTYVQRKYVTDTFITLPTEGAAGQILTTNGAGIYTWTTADVGDPPTFEVYTESGTLLTNDGVATIGTVDVLSGTGSGITYTQRNEDLKSTLFLASDFVYIQSGSAKFETNVTGLSAEFNDLSISIDSNFIKLQADVIELTNINETGTVYLDYTAVSGNFNQILQSKSGTIALLSDVALGAVTNLDYNPAPAQGEVYSSTGTDAIIPLANEINAGLLSSTEKSLIAASLQPGDQTSALTNNGSDGTSSYVEMDELAAVALDNNYNSLSNKPIVITPTGLETVGEIGIGLAIVGRNEDNYGIIGNSAVDLSFSTSSSFIRGATGDYSFAEGRDTFATGLGSHAEGYSTQALGEYSHTEGANTEASGSYSHAEGYQTTATGLGSHAEGYDTNASANYSHAQGYQTIASGAYSHAEGSNTEASGNYAHAEGSYNIASGYNSHAHGHGNTAFSWSETSIGIYSTEYVPISTLGWNSGDRMFNIGIGLNSLEKEDGFTILKNGNTAIGISNFEANDSGAKLQVAGTIQSKGYTVATLPVGSAMLVGMTAYVTDATAPTYLGTLTGGGAITCPVFYNGTEWVSH